MRKSILLAIALLALVPVTSADNSTYVGSTAPGVLYCGGDIHIGGACKLYCGRACMVWVDDDNLPTSFFQVCNTGPGESDCSTLQQVQYYHDASRGNGWISVYVYGGTTGFIRTYPS